MAEPYLSQLRDLLAEVGLDEHSSSHLECRHFFAGAALYIENSIGASLSPAGLALKLPKASREALLEKGLGSPLRYFEGGRVKKEYVVLSESVLADPSEVRELFHLCFHYVRGKRTPH